MENGCGGRSLSLSFRMESTTDGSRIPRLAEFARIKTNSSGLITPKAGWSIRLSQSKVVWWTRPGSNRRPPHCERGALPAELLAHEQQIDFNKRPRCLPTRVPLLVNTNGTAHVLNRSQCSAPNPQNLTPSL